jgi:hypothetical protein
MDEVRPEPIEQIRQRYEGEWLLIKVTKHDRSGFPVEGILLLHTPDKEEIHEAILNLREQGETGELMFWFEGPLVPEGWEVVLSVLDEV